MAPYAWGKSAQRTEDIKNGVEIKENLHENYKDVPNKKERKEVYSDRNKKIVLV